MKFSKLFKKAAALCMAAVTALSLIPATTAFAAGDIGTISFSHTYDSGGNAMRYNSSATINGYTAGGTGNYKYRIPSFLSGGKNDITKELAYKDGKYSITLTDKNGVLSDYSFTSSDANVSVSKDGNKLTISSKKAISGSVRITATRNGVPTVSDSARLIAYGDPNLQDLVTGVENADSVKAYINVETPTGTIALKKTSEDGVVAGMKIAGILTERKRKTASGLVKWSVSNIMRAIKNATYTGTKCYNKSRSNNFLEQKRINNLDMSTYEYVEGDFPAIVSQEVWDKAQKIRESRMKPSLVSTSKTTHSKRDSKDIWVNKLRCSCGSSFRKDKWHTKLDGKISYGYQCYNQINNGNKKKRAALGLDTEGYCDIKMITDWKLDFMAKELLEHLWQDRKVSVIIAIDLIKRYYKDDRLNENQHDAVSIKAKIEKAQTRLTNLIAMRADGELSKEEYQAMRKPIDTEIQQLQEKLNQAPNDEQPKRGLELDGIISTLNTLIDFSGTKVSEEVINQFVYRVTPTSDTTFDWYVNLSGTADVKATFTAEGRKSRAVVKLEEIEQISSLHRKENEDNGMFLKNPLVFTFLHRLLSRLLSN